MARTKGTWGTVREVPRKGSGRWQASYVHGGIWGVERGVRFTAPQIFETRGDAYAWLGREHRLVDRDDWTPPGERIRQAKVRRANSPFTITPPDASEPHDLPDVDHLAAHRQKGQPAPPVPRCIRG